MLALILLTLLIGFGLITMDTFKVWLVGVMLLLGSTLPIAILLYAVFSFIETRQH